MKCTITHKAYKLLLEHGADDSAPQQADTTHIIDLDDDVVEALEMAAPDTGDAVHDLSEAIIRVCTGMFGRA